MIYGIIARQYGKLHSCFYVQNFTSGRLQAGFYKQVIYPAIIPLGGGRFNNSPAGAVFYRLNGNAGNFIDPSGISSHVYPAAAA
jgi:hypothetical protein